MIRMRASDAARVTGAVLSGDDVRFDGCTTDSRNVNAGQLFIALKGERFDGHRYVGAAAAAGACAALVEEDVGDADLTLLRCGDSRRAMGDLAGYWRGCFDLPLIALTGSNGKTTVKEMIAAVVSRRAPVLATRGNLNNDIGVPLTLFGLGNEHRCAIIEMGANHAGEIDYLSRMARPTVALITQCAPAHLEGFESVDGVARAKAEIFRGLMQDGVAVINADDEYAGYWFESAGSHRRITFGLEQNADVSASDIQVDEDQQRQSFVLRLPGAAVDVTLAMPGRHNVMNALAAAACCCVVDIPPEVIRSGLEQCRPVTGRLQVKVSKAGVRVVDDSYNANPGSLRAGLEVLTAYPGRHWLVLGDMGELGESGPSLHEQVGELARESGVERLYALGPLTEHTVRGFGEGARHFDDAGDLLQALQADAGSRTSILVKGSRAMAMERIVNRLLEED